MSSSEILPNMLNINVYKNNTNINKKRQKSNGI